MPAQVYLTLTVDGASVRPEVAVMSSGNNWTNGCGERTPADMNTVRELTRITNRVLDFAEGIKA